MTASIFDILATLPSGKPGARLTTDEFAAYLKQWCDTDAEKARNRRHALRDELYRDGGDQHMASVIEQLFDDTDIRKKRRAFIPYARFNNALKRMVNEMATTHSEPARRVVSDETNNEKYQRVLKLVCMDEQMLQVSRLANLHRALLVGFRVRMRPDGTREPMLDIATPASVRAVMHPNDDKLVIGWMIKCSHRAVPGRDDNAPAWTLWTDRESVHLRDDLSPIAGSYEEHGLGVIPWVPLSLGPAAPGFWPGCEGEDMVAGHVSIWLENILLLKESKSATNQTIISGDGTSMARGQAADSEVPLELADGQNATTVDMSMDLSMFRDTADHVLQHLAQNYGMSPALIQHQGVQSAEARELMRLPLKEIRRQQQQPLRRFEEQLAIVMSSVLKIDHPELAFEVRDWRIEFAESETPLDPIAEHDLFEKRRAAALDSTVAFLMRQRPGLTKEAALAIISENILNETDRNRLMRPLQSISGSLGASTEDGTPTPFEMNRGKLSDNENAPDLKAIAKEVLSAAN
jgi:hypothetical protein